MRTALQRSIEQRRAVYGHLEKPMLAQMCELHGLTTRDLASIFEVSRSHIAEVIAQKKFPDLELALRLSRYFEVTVEDLFGWQLDDTGKRRPMIIETPSGLVRLSVKNPYHTALGLVEAVARQMEGENGVENR